MIIFLCFLYNSCNFNYTPWRWQQLVKLDNKYILFKFLVQNKPLTSKILQHFETQSCFKILLFKTRLIFFYIVSFSDETNCRMFWLTYSSMLSFNFRVIILTKCMIIMLELHKWVFSSSSKRCSFVFQSL